MKLRIKDDEFVSGIARELSKYVGSDVEVTLRTHDERKLITYTGKISKILDDSFIIALPHYEDGILTGYQETIMKMIDVHYLGPYNWSEDQERHPVFFVRWRRKE